MQSARQKKPYGAPPKGHNNRGPGEEVYHEMVPRNGSRGTLDLMTYEGGILTPSQQSSGLCSPGSGGWGPVSHAAASLSNYSLSNLSGSETSVVFGVKK